MNRKGDSNDRNGWHCCQNENQKINYDRVLKKMIQQWERTDERPKIMLHSCCAPCSTYVLEFLSQYADLAIYFANPNIHPKRNMNAELGYKRIL